VVKSHGSAVILQPRTREPYPDVGALLRDGPRGLAAARAADRRVDAIVDYDERNLLRPVLQPGAVVCVGLNYRRHILEMGRELPEHPTYFSKLARALTDPFADIPLPRVSQRVDYEGELAVVIGRAGRDIGRWECWDYVAGFTVLNDVTMRDYQRRSPQWFAGKSFQSSTPVGPVIVTTEELDDLPARELRVSVNDSERQRASLGDLVFDVPFLVADLSRIIELQPGDLIATGTPGGVGEPENQFLTNGDIVEVAIDGIGSIRNTFKRPTS